MASILRLYLDIALLRRGPQDVPVSPRLLYGTLLAFLAINAALTAAFRPEGADWAGQLLVSAAFTLLWYRVVLQLFGRVERYQQTVTAVLGFGCVVAPVIVPLAGRLVAYVDRPEEALPLMLVLLPLAGYLIYVSARILNAAIERPMFQCVALVLLQTFLEPLLLAALFGAGAPPAATSG